MNSVSNPYSYWFNPQMYNMYQYPFWFNPQIYSMHQNQFWSNIGACSQHFNIQRKDYGPDPFVVNIENASIQNKTFRTALWTGENLQITLMSIEPGDDIGVEVHENGDQFVRVKSGQGLVQMGDNKDNLDFQRAVYDDSAILIPAGKWHNITNVGTQPLKLYAIYGPPEHPYNTIHQTKADSEADEKEDENY